MPYYTRVFCASKEIAPLGEILRALQDKGVLLTVNQKETPVDLTEAGWRQAALLYKEDREPIVVECARDSGSDEDLVKAETGEFAEEIGAPGISLKKRRVLKHLKNKQTCKQRK